MTTTARSTIAYVVLAHRNPAQVTRLVRRLTTEQAMFLVHVDRRADAAVSAAVRRDLAGHPQARVVRERRCYWGGFGMVRATLDALDELARRDLPCDHVVLVSGQDYPLRPAEEIERFLGGAGEHSFMTAAQLPDIWPDGGLPRFERWHLVSGIALHLRVPWTRRIPGGLLPFGGGAWLCLSRAAAAYVVDFVRRNPGFVRFFEHVLHPDELFFQTILMNSALAETVVPDHLRYIDWSTVPGPATLGVGDFETLTASESLLARKFDETVDPEILDLLDRHIERSALAPAR